MFHVEHSEHSNTQCSTWNTGLTSKKAFLLATLCAFGFLLTFSKGAFLLAIGLFLYKMFHVEHPGRLKSFYTMFHVEHVKFLIPIILWITIVFFALYTLLHNSQSLSERENLLFLFSEGWSPSLWGSGLGTTVVENIDRGLVNPDWFLQPVHNVYLIALGETGLLGLLAWTFTLFKHFLEPCSTWNICGNCTRMFHVEH